MKKVLFLAPNYKYICTTVTGVGKALDRAHVKYTTNVNEWGKPLNSICEQDELYLRLEVFEVIFVYSDPVEWTCAMLSGIDAVYGKKELVEKCRERFYSSRAILYRNGSLEKFILNAIQNEADPTICDFPPKTQYIPEIKNVYSNDPVTVVIWDDGTKTMVRCQDGDFYSEETGLAVCIAKKALGNKGNFNNVFKKWLPANSEVETMETGALSYYIWAALENLCNSKNKEEKND